MAVAALVAVFFAGCGQKILSYSDLVSNSAKYNNQTVTVEGYYFEGANLKVLTIQLLTVTGSSDYIPDPDEIWLEGSLPAAVESALYSQTGPTGYDERFGMIRVTGKYAFGGEYGYQDHYQYQLTISNAILLNWTPSTA